MIPISVFTFLICVFFVMGMCAFLLKNHDLYADVLLAVGSAVLGWYLSISILIGNVGYTDVETITAIKINGTTEMVYEMVVITFQNVSLAYMLSGVSLVMTIYALFICIGIVIEILKGFE